ncbi:acyl-CoA dehydrogenase [candidate division KSB3 bacterium]|uniref:Acyl-CoA dehydrogenase n=1 Tax=candidate division KSB3 bacterium TaxID=2044937 RepID=A0A9D5JVK6_9BACT|nr:acyl-CoA dehydrogenase [candidate division KSB3 bacterium]MBD3324948.1 acyl-CoA dehydrogenase [candidate division KSB3 bacterium]
MSPRQQILDEARQFVEEHIRPFAADFEANEALPRTLIEQMAANGYLAASFPEEYGGLALDPVSYGLLTEEIGKGCSSARGLLTVHTSLVGETLLRWGTEEQKTTWLPRMARGEKLGAFALTEPEVGTDAKSVQTSYRREGETFFLNGKKKWISFGDIADVFIVIASNGGEVSAFLVERQFPGVSTAPIKGLLAGRAAHIAEIDLTDVAVPAENVVGKVGSGFTYVVTTALDHGRYSIAWAGIAIAQAALEAMVTYSRTRSQFGQKIYNFQLIKGIIGDAVTKVHAARTLCLKAGEMRKNGHEDAIIETTIAKYFSSKIAMQVATDAVQVHGGNGCSNQYPVERLFREAKVLEIIEGTSQIQQEIISRYGLRKYYRGKR